MHAKGPLLRFFAPFASLLLLALPAYAQSAPAASAPPPTPPAKSKSQNKSVASVIELPAAPILDGEGHQRLDPDGKPMFYPPVKQQRDKKGRPLFDEKNKPVFQTAKDLGYDEDGHRIQVTKEKAPKTVGISIRQGTLTVDGLTGKAGLNYEIADLRYIYIFVPWIGTTIISNAPFPGATEQPKAFEDKTLTVNVADHTLQIYSDKPLLGKKPEPAYVTVDRGFSYPSKVPVMGYGSVRQAPYAWPGAGIVAPGTSEAPPLPENLKPTSALPPCPTGYMRPATPSATKAKATPTPACVPIDRIVPNAGVQPPSLR